MAGIGFEIKKILNHASYFSIVKTYSIAGIIGSGPWVLSILSVLIIGLISKSIISDKTLVIQFLVCVTYLMAASLILTGFVQLLFTRFMADKLFEKKNNLILPNLMGMMWLMTAASVLVSGSFVGLLFSENLLFKLLMIANFAVLCNLWIVILFLSSMKRYVTILMIFLVGYSASVILSNYLSIFNKEGLLFSVLIGHSILLFSFLFIIIRNYPGSEFIRFDFLKKKQVFISLSLTGFLFNLGIWLDKIIFWYTPHTSQQVIGPLRSSIIYDLPIFIAYLSIIPGMAVFMVRMEADFAKACEKFYDSIREGDTLERITFLKGQMVYIARQGIYEIFKVQGFVLVLLILWGRDILRFVGISELYAPLFYIDVVAVSVQLLLLSILNYVFYLDLRYVSVIISGIFMVLNGLLTWVSIQLGVLFYGYGYAISMAVATVIGILILSKKFYDLEYETFMLRY